MVAYTCAEQINSTLHFLSYSEKCNKSAGSNILIDTARHVLLHTALKGLCNYGWGHIMSMVASVKWKPRLCHCILCCTFPWFSHSLQVRGCCIWHGAFVFHHHAITWTSSSACGQEDCWQAQRGNSLKTNEACLIAQYQAHVHTTNHTYTLRWWVLICQFGPQQLICQKLVTANISVVIW